MKKLFCSCLLIVLFTSLSAQQSTYFPERNATWEVKSPKDFKFDDNSLQQAVQFAKENEYSGSRDLRIAILKGFEREPFHEILGPTKKRGGPAGMILKSGYLVASWGDVKRVDMTFSVTKSFLSTVAGLALDYGLIKDVSDKVSQYVWDGSFDGEHNSKINWEHLLQQNSDWSGTLWGGKDWADRPPREGGLDDWKFRKLNEPGTVMEYNDVRVNLLAYSLTQVWRKSLPAVLKENLMDKIGASTTWRWFGYENAWTVIDGVEVKSVTGGGHSGGGIFINTEDMARFGLLFLNDGKWKGKELISKSWISKATTPSKPNPNYGYLWWLNTEGDDIWKAGPILCSTQPDSGVILLL
ncbi:serine hydrolase domain-containing protein [Muriicola soli]|uniref:serine hydrolase domain-containing protein n=1 Tax=Muriicola soli TaxID=2507538 RepID=UPI001FEAD01B|nr:serine hydrolase [Muriicola soli]